MDKIQKKLYSDYWAKKLRNCNFREIEGPEFLQNETIELAFMECRYFREVTVGSKISEYTVLLAIYGVLIKRYFDENFIYSKNTFDDVGLKKGVDLVYKLENINDSLKNFIKFAKTEVQEVYKHGNYDKTSVETRIGGALLENATDFSFFYGVKIGKKTKSRFSLQVNKRNNKAFEFFISYSRNLIEKSLVVHFLNNVKNLVKNLEPNINLPANKISIIPRHEETMLLEDFNRSSFDYGKEKVNNLIDLFEKQAASTPNNIAIAFEENLFTYKEINEKANKLARHLRKCYDLIPNELVGIKLSRNEQLITSIFSVLKTGAAYVPMDIDYPENHIKFIEKDSNCKIIIDETFLQDFYSSKQNYPSENLTKTNKKTDLAYVIYTSGTSGKAKGVMITHRNAIELILWAKGEFKDSNFDILYATTSHCFDLSIFEMFYPLSIGSKIRILKNGLDIRSYLLKDSKVFLNTVPSLLRKLLQDKRKLMENTTVLNLAGEPFPIDLANTLTSAKREVRNLYGPSEDTTYSTSYKLLDQSYTNSIPIGKPIRNTQAYILDENLELLPLGVVGRLFLSGSGVGKGYINRSKLTKEKFIVNPFVLGQRMYDTGDLAKWLPDGNISFIGRNDSQIKLNGYRIELGEIENAIAQFSKDMEQNIVNIQEIRGGKVLVSYYVSRREQDKSALKNHLIKNLPRYMVPSHYFKLDSIPLTPNGKINIKSLPKIEMMNIIRKEYIPPRSVTEKELIKIWEDVIGVKDVGIRDDFFELGGHSLMILQTINKMNEKLEKDISFKLFYKYPTIEGLIDNLKGYKFHSIPKIQHLRCYPTTPAQKSIWLISQFVGGSLAYSINGALSITGHIDIENFKKAIRYTVERHEILRTYFKTDEEGNLKQFILSESELNLPIAVKDFSSLNNSTVEVQKYVKNQCSRGFELSKAPLFRTSLIKAKAESFIFLISIHHIISDGWSLEVLRSEVLENYQNLELGKRISRPKLPIQFKDYTIWLITAIKTSQKKSMEYWLNLFQGELPVLDFPSFNRRPKIKTYVGDELSQSFSAEVLRNLKFFSANYKVSLFVTIMSVVRLLVFRYSNQKDFILGAPIAGRDHPDLESQIGLYINILAIRTKIKENDCFLDLLQREKQQLLGAHSHKNLPFDALVEKLNINKDRSRSPLFDILVVLQNQRQLTSLENDLNALNLTIDEFKLRRDASQYDLSFTFVENDGLTINLAYNKEIHKESFIRMIISHLENLFIQILESPYIELARIDFLPIQDKQILLNDFNETKAEYSENKTVVDLFAEQVEKKIHKPAIAFQEKIFTYKELDEISSRFANFLIEYENIKPNDFIGIELIRSEWVIISILGVLKCGACYVPIDIEAPKKRKDYVKKDSNCKFNINSKIIDFFEEHLVSYGIEHPPLLNTLDSLAYTIYTSGSTGLPKGVMVSHANLVSFFANLDSNFGFSKINKLALTTNITFDISVLEILGGLCRGKELFLFPVDILKDPVEIFSELKRLEIEGLQVTPSRLSQLYSTGLNFPKSVRVMLIGGEALSLKLYNRLKNESFISINCYGPTEATIWSTILKIKASTQLSIGKPLYNEQIYILNSENILQAIGVVGEICIGGLGVAKGYLNKSNLTKEKFIPNPFNADGVIYKTGDLGKWLPDGHIEFIGRKDNQIKVRGHRVEIEEIEHTFRKIANIIDVAIDATKNRLEEVELTAYLICKKPMSINDLRILLLQFLPNHMIPSHYVFLKIFPMNSSGKLDRRALKTVKRESFSNSIKYVPPRNETEKKLVEIWQNILDRSRIGIHDSFFELGGNSLKAVRIVSEIQRKFNVKIELEKLLSEQNIEELAIEIANYYWHNAKVDEKKIADKLTI